MSEETVNFRFTTIILISISTFLMYSIPLDKSIKQSLGYYRDSLLNFTELTKHYGYKTEVHDVITDDGYILTLFHVTGSKNCLRTIKKPPILLLHGLMESADLFLDAGTNSGLGYLIPDNCFDLWVGNQRGNYYGRRHIELDPDKDSKFWNFTAEEMAYYDIPGMFDYILNYTNSNNLIYIGYSQGGSNFFIMCSDRHEYCNKTRLMIALAPATMLSNMESIPFRILSKVALVSQYILEYFGKNEVLYKGSFLQELLEYICQYNGLSIIEKVCGTAGFFADSYHPGSISFNTQRSLFGHFPAGTSVKTLARYSQIIASGKFQKYDYGETINLETYGTKYPPEYNLSAVTAPVVIINGQNDMLTTVKDIKRTEDLLSNLVDAVKITDPLWNHLDIVYSQYAQHMVFPTVKKYLNQYSDEEICEVY